MRDERARLSKSRRAERASRRFDCAKISSWQLWKSYGSQLVGVFFQFVFDEHMSHCYENDLNAFAPRKFHRRNKIAVSRYQNYSFDNRFARQPRDVATSRPIFISTPFCLMSGVKSSSTNARFVFKISFAAFCETTQPSNDNSPERKAILSIIFKSFIILVRLENVDVVEKSTVFFIQRMRLLFAVGRTIIAINAENFFVHFQTFYSELSDFDCRRLSFAERVLELEKDKTHIEQNRGFLHNLTYKSKSPLL